jgi:NAD(P)-dependent dehydrogenase (short-subunit alcohol dehydrogenase family)
MELGGRVAVVTGAGRGIGRAIAAALVREGSRVMLADLEGAPQAAAALGAEGMRCDVRCARDIEALVAETEQRLGPVEIFVSNAGVGFGEPDHAASAPDAHWQACWEVNVMAQVHAARAVLPGMIARGEGYLVNMASAAGLLAQIGDAAYTATKHAALGFAESLAIAHRDDGVRVSVVCPQYVATRMIGYADGDPGHASGVLSPEAVAEAVLEGMEAERFLILPHPQVATHVARKAGDPERWLEGMRALRRRALKEHGRADPVTIHRLV